MRKPAVVAVAAVLAGGIMIATRPGGEEAPAPPVASQPGALGVPPAFGPAGPPRPRIADDPAKPAAGKAGVATRTGLRGKPAAGKAGVATRTGPRGKPAAGKASVATRTGPRGKPAAGKAGVATRTGPRRKPVAVKRVTRRDVPTNPRGSVQQQALELVNANRRRGGCGNLTVDRRLIVAANRHAAEMARRGRFAHEDARGGLAGDRVRDAGYRWTRYGENIAHGQDSVAEVVAGWLKSRAHRENIMDCDLREVGVGRAFAADGTPYWVQDLATPQ